MGGGKCAEGEWRADRAYKVQGWSGSDQVLSSQRESGWRSGQCPLQPSGATFVTGNRDAYRVTAHVTATAVLFRESAQNSVIWTQDPAMDRLEALSPTWLVRDYPNCRSNRCQQHQGARRGRLQGRGPLTPMLSTI